MIREMLEELQAREFYGSLELKFEGGSIVLVKKTETMKPADNNRQRSTRDGHGHES